MFKLEFIDRITDEVFREVTFNSPKEMHAMLIQFDLKEGEQISFFDKQLRTLSANFVAIIPFINGETKGFRLLFDVSVAEKQLEIYYNEKK
ncbi:hypothetical protein CVD28_11635 [Bacillus sp. M6-12]|uniref:hypothetical protein n=1 Tax=Bacillus sp. M6-12 TaxID=2054166 RepID=UPI000C76B22A|nr:hypothetical protein [Bacillus sp. M6-12]PLS17635.1 hypothetical protein CVD28_11635 [Bacillus sp. M6-12]